MTMRVRCRPVLPGCLVGLLALASSLGAQPRPGAFRPPIEVELPALVAAETAPWVITHVDGMEVLALGPDDAVRTFLQNILLQRANLNAMLPESMRIGWERPLTVILYSVENQRPLPENFGPLLSRLFTEREREQAAENREGRPLEAHVVPRIMTGTWVPDIDGVCVFSAMPPRPKASELSSLPAAIYVHFLLQSRMPAQPAWLIDGYTYFYNQASVNGGDLDLAPFTWVSPAQTQLMLKNRRMPVEFLSMSEVFNYTSVARVGDDERRRSLLRSQAALLIRWLFDTRSAGGPEALWRFLEGPTTGPEGESWFRTCFGMTPEAMLEALRAYLPQAIRRPARTRLARDARLPAFELRPAAPAEIARVKGEWDRLASRLAAVQFPSLRPFYHEQARRTVAHGPDDASADPALLGARGLVAVEVGDDAAALPLLEAAAASPGVRPRVHVELARIRLAHARAAAGEGARIEPAAAEAIAATLRGVLDSRPPMPRAFQLLAETWEAASAEPPAADTAALQRGLSLAPGDASLAIAVARLWLQLGRLDEAQAAVDHALGHVTDDSSRRRLYGIASAIRAARSR